MFFKDNMKRNSDKKAKNLPTIYFKTMKHALKDHYLTCLYPHMKFCCITDTVFEHLRDQLNKEDLPSPPKKYVAHKMTGNATTVATSFLFK
jgi:hypothetical protein